MEDVNKKIRDYTSETRSKGSFLFEGNGKYMKLGNLEDDYIQNLRKDYESIKNEIIHILK